VRGGEPGDATAEDRNLRHVPTLYRRGVRVRRDLLVLGAVAAALLIAIVAFAASGTVNRQSSVPTPTATATPASERDLFGGSLESRVRYQTRVFEPPLSFVPGDAEWLVVNASRPDDLVLERRYRNGQPGGELPSRSALIFSRIDEIVDPRTGDAIHVDDLYPWLKQHPDLDVSRAKAVTLAGLDGLRFDEHVRFRRPARPASVCRPQLIECTLIAPNRYYANGIRMHTILLPLDRAPLVIDIVGRTQRDLDRVEAPAEELLQTLTVTRP
jgi:hypothetical protein